MEAELAELRRNGGTAEDDETFIDVQITPSEGLEERKAIQRRKDRVMANLHELPERAQTAILESLTADDMQRYGVSPGPSDTRTRPFHRPFHG